MGDWDYQGSIHEHRDDGIGSSPMLLVPSLSDTLSLFGMYLLFTRDLGHPTVEIHPWK